MFLGFKNRVKSIKTAGYNVEKVIKEKNYSTVEMQYSWVVFNEQYLKRGLVATFWWPMLLTWTSSHREVEHGLAYKVIN